MGLLLSCCAGSGDPYLSATRSMLVVQLASEVVGAALGVAWVVAWPDGAERDGLAVHAAWLLCAGRRVDARTSGRGVRGSFGASCSELQPQRGAGAAAFAT